jgi:hypothetical protein
MKQLFKKWMYYVNTEPAYGMFVTLIGMATIYAILLAMETIHLLITAFTGD